VPSAPLSVWRRTCCTTSGCWPALLGRRRSRDHCFRSTRAGRRHPVAAAAEATVRLLVGTRYRAGGVRRDVFVVRVHCRADHQRAQPRTRRPAVAQPFQPQRTPSLKLPHGRGAGWRSLPTDQSGRVCWYWALAGRIGVSSTSPACIVVRCPSTHTSIGAALHIRSRNLASRGVSSTFTCCPL
jgi:hypothetical protein